MRIRLKTQVTNTRRHYFVRTNQNARYKRFINDSVHSLPREDLAKIASVRQRSTTTLVYNNIQLCQCLSFTTDITIALLLCFPIDLIALRIQTTAAEDVSVHGKLLMTIG